MERLINEVNPIIRGWAESKRNWQCTKTYRKIDHWLYNIQIRYAKRRQPNKNITWIKEKYFTTKTGYKLKHNYVFYSKEHKTYKLKFRWFRYQQHVVVRDSVCNDRPQDQEYWSQRSKQLLSKKTKVFRNEWKKELMKMQNSLCPVCGDD